MDNMEMMTNETMEQAEPVAKENETKAEKFVRLAEYRINKAMDAIGRLEALSNRSSYEYSPEQVEAMFGALQSRIDAVKEPFMAKKVETAGFSFGAVSE